MCRLDAGTPTCGSHTRALPVVVVTYQLQILHSCTTDGRPIASSWQDLTVSIHQSRSFRASGRHNPNLSHATPRPGDEGSIGSFDVQPRQSLWRVEQYAYGRGESWSTSGCRKQNIRGDQSVIIKARAVSPGSHGFVVLFVYDLMCFISHSSLPLKAIL